MESSQQSELEEINESIGKKIQNVSARLEIFREIIFISEYGKLRIKPLVIQFVQGSPLVSFLQQIEDQLIKITVLSHDFGNFAEIYRIARSFYSFSFKKPKNVTREAVVQLKMILDLLLLSTCIQLLETGIIQNEYNPCYAFAAHERLISNLLELNDIDEINVEGIFLTASVYLYSLSAFLNGRRNPNNFSNIYSLAITNLNQENPKKNFISWALKMAYDDSDTRDTAIKRKPMPSL